MTFPIYKHFLKVIVNYKLEDSICAKTYVFEYNTNYKFHECLVIHYGKSTFSIALVLLLLPKGFKKMNEE